MNTNYPEPPPEQCCNCRFSINYDCQLYCHKRAPIIYKHYEYAKWPIVMPDYWCGDFKYDNKCIRDAFKTQVIEAEKHKKAIRDKWYNKYKHDSFMGKLVRWLFKQK